MKGSEKMDKQPIRSAAARLSCYILYKNLLDSGMAEELNEEINLRAELFELRRSVLSLPDSRERFYLYNRYIHGRTTEKCAELLGISRRSAFRLRERALALYAERHKTDYPQVTE